MEPMTLLGLLGLALIVAGLVGAGLLAKRADELHEHGAHGHHKAH